MPKGVAKGEFLILEVGEARSIGAALVLRGVAESEKKAKEDLEKMSAASGARLAIVETRGVFTREPVVTLKSAVPSFEP